MEGRYLFYDFHEVYFTNFPILLFGWLEKQMDIRIVGIPQEPIIWTKERIK